MVIWDQEGNVMSSPVRKKLKRISPQKLQKLWQFFGGLTFAIDTGLLPVLVESNVLEVVNLINSGKDISAKVGLYVGDIRELLLCNSGCSIGYAFRKENVVTHNISKLALSAVEDCYPTCVEQFVQDDCPG
ncbi:hypothetical protein LWI29_027236 [Acer saccharum]|uniref:RNase H type-1 domain-containing protein n=1 Tax=Acer saccharum TaxID=4024 RepID=A0AA39VFE4_ACESA|nr:hypothetical protein LWI29_010838 [Acer saccharum]KAK0608213.1 hypothetical protein LWI29_027236 [Acer saccharum]